MQFCYVDVSQIERAMIDGGIGQRYRPRHDISQHSAACSLNAQML